MSRLNIFTRLDGGTWGRVQAESLQRRTLTVLGAFMLAAWNRFGAQGFLGPRAPVRFVLTGIYGWLALTLAIWFIAQRTGPSVEGSPIYLFQRAAASVTVAHFPLIILGMYMATFGAFIRTPVPGTILAVIVFAAWIPLLLSRAMQHMSDMERNRALALAAIPYLLWLAWIGRFLHSQVGHLL